MSDSPLARLVDTARRRLFDRGAEPVPDAGRRLFFHRAGAAAIGTGLMMPEVARATGTPLDLRPDTVVDARGRPVRNPKGNQPYIGEIMLFAGNFAVQGWAICNGQLMAISQYDALFSILGTTYGGDGVTTFGLPDLRGRAAVHQGQGTGLTNHTLGQKGGVETITMTTATMPSHTHTLPVFNNAGTLRRPNGTILAGDDSSDMIYAPPTAATGQLAPSDRTGGGLPFNIQSPFLALNFQMALYGIYPSRS